MGGVLEILPTKMVLSLMERSIKRWDATKVNEKLPPLVAIEVFKLNIPHKPT